MTRYTGEILLSVFLFVFVMLATFGRIENPMICKHCSGGKHADCPGGTRCDCQHREPAPPAEEQKAA